MSITEVFTNPPIGSPGSCADTGNTDPVSITLQDDVAPGLFVTQGTEDRTAAAINAAPDLLLALVMKQELIAPDAVNSDGEYVEGTTVAGKKTGRSHVFGYGAFGPGDPVYVRYVATVDEPVGSLSATADPGKNRLVPAAAISWVTSGEDEIGEVELHLHDDAIDDNET